MMNTLGFRRLIRPKEVTCTKNSLTAPLVAYSISRVLLNEDFKPAPEESLEEITNRLRNPSKKNSFDISPLSSESTTKLDENPIQVKTIPKQTNFARTSGAYRLMKDAVESTKKTVDKYKEFSKAKDLSSQIYRQWNAGDVYAPHDLHQAELSKFRLRTFSTVDLFDILNINPLEHYRNFSIMSEWMTPMGRIKPRKETALRPVNQRRIAKAIRRSIGIGIMPSVYRHPEILYKDLNRYGNDPNKY
ncbi:putative 37s ribosomal protein [Erysiphe neolycopersici]|uniref:Small ribosomal subunit protein bS18m n=1 Tax=Erysiphe neolycopersici TaxID=212602 RepID=A0A420HRW0_9PEZI|nr:putative 37s ribosomal protein [Erysiphe neolycopersici]